MTPDHKVGPSSAASGVEDAGSVPAQRIGWQGLALILVFWTFFGGVMSASLFLSDLPRTGEATLLGLVGFTLLGAYAWAALTLPLFRLTERLNLTGDGGMWRGLRVVGLLVFGLSFSVLVSVAVSLTTVSVLPHLFGGRLTGPEGFWVMVRYRVPYDLLACFLVLSTGVALDYFFRYRTRLAESALLRTQLAEARLKVLRAQLNPHFLFNTLNAVAALVQTDPRGVREMIALLSDMLRQTLDGASEPEVPLEQELELMRRYLAIMEIRFRGRLEARITADADAMQALVPHLILQPLVENALKHGIGYESELGVVEVEATRRGGELVLTVRDSGLGPSVDGPTVFMDRAPNGRSGGSGGFGLRHTRERLWALYQDGGRLELKPREGGGTVAEVRLPYHLDRPLPDDEDGAAGDPSVAATRSEAVQ